MNIRHCGLCEDKTTNQEFCDKCLELSRRMDLEVKKRLKKRKGVTA
ncbi:hypothetical protein BH753_gp011 [Bacillus phage Shbh1]|uniref:Uncharacterized protein n=1 Tax=Bacillus phage Shbh1 TaxID=1796992 RepID=A0A142F136_9CAUD|nr:hypothetical protein BH753_gp011 [Bacillus phage Shbh1]AMQ66493.1 hypothetical protein [Bacillus phage Shbh1]